MAKAEKQKTFLFEEVFHRELDPQITESLAYDFFRLKFQLNSNEFVFKQGQTSDFVYLLKKGRIQIIRDEIIHNKLDDLTMLNSQKKLKRLPVAEIGKGEFFGDEFLAKFGPRFYTAICLSQCNILRVSRACIQTHITRYRELGRFLISSIRQKQEQRKKILKIQYSKIESEIMNHNLGNHETQNIHYDLNENAQFSSFNPFDKAIVLSTKIVKKHALPQKSKEKSVDICDKKERDLLSKVLPSRSLPFKFYKAERDFITNSNQRSEYLSLKNDMKEGRMVDMNFIEICKKSRMAKMLEKKNAVKDLKYITHSKTWANQKPRAYIGSSLEKKDPTKGKLQEDKKLKKRSLTYAEKRSSKPTSSFFNRKSTYYKPHRRTCRYTIFTIPNPLSYSLLKMKKSNSQLQNSQHHQDLQKQQPPNLKITTTKSLKRYNSSVYLSPEVSRSKISKFIVPHERSSSINYFSENKFDSLNVVDFSENRKLKLQNAGQITDTLKRTGFFIKRKGSCGDLTDHRIEAQTIQTTPKREKRKMMKLLGGSSKVGIHAQMRAVIGAKGLLRRTKKNQSAVKSTWNFIMKKDTDENEY